MTTENVASAQKLINRIASDNYRLKDSSVDRNGEDIYSPEVMSAIIELGHIVDILSDLLEVEDYRSSVDKLTDEEDE